MNRKPDPIVTDVRPDPRPPAAIAREFRELLHAGARLAPAGEAKGDPGLLLQPRYAPAYRVDLFGKRFYLSRPRKNPSVRYFIAYLAGANGRGAIYPRIFYKDLSLVWRAASHLVANDDEFWIGKGAVHYRNERGYEVEESVESTTDLPLEIQGAIEDINRSQKKVVQDERPLFLVLRNGPPGRIAPYRDFTAAREAAALRGERIYGGRRVAVFGRRNVPESLRFAAGYEPDFGAVVERTASSSQLYGGVIDRYRILSTNRRIQYLFMAAPRHVWVVPPQATSQELSSFGVRVVDVHADDDLFVPGFEYHYLEDDEDPPRWVSQIPPGFVGPPAEFDSTRADARPWLDRLPVVREFRRRVLRRR
ncbi:hypothetical protein ABI59_06910 [Acidobacteria bacterium Mor1]|nr:hypothetical protein ABI59_06910 [Acidobacteria bacterium Mor1]